MKSEIVYGALAALLLLTLASALYTYSETQSVKTRLTALEKRPESVALIVNALERRVASLENQVKNQASSAKLIAFYDSSCAVCANDVFLNTVPAMRSNLEQQGIRIETVDVKDTPQPALAVGVKTVPTFFASSSDLVLSKNLTSFIYALPNANFGLYEISTGTIAQPPTPQTILQSNSCEENNSIKIEEFYSTTCSFCRRVFYANGTAFNSNTDPRFAEVAGEALSNISAKYGEKIQNTSRCIGVHSLGENQIVLNVNASDGALCVEAVGEEAYKENERAAGTYGVIGVPALVVDCKYIVKARQASRLEEQLCTIRPELCESKIAAVLNELNAANKTTPS